MDEAATFVPNVATSLSHLWDVNGNVYVSANVIYRAKRGSSSWELVSGSVGKTFVTADPAGNLYATEGGVSKVLLIGANAWVAVSGITFVDPRGFAWSGGSQLKGADAVPDDLWTRTARFDANGDVVDQVADGDTGRIKRHTPGAVATELVSYPLVGGHRYELLGCGLEGTCVVLRDADDVMQIRPSEKALTKIGSTLTTSTGDSLNFSGFRLTVGPDGLLYLVDVSGQTINFSRVFRLRPGTNAFPPEESP